MKTIGNFAFPETMDEGAAWHPCVCSVPLASRVMAVMRTRIEGAWAAYIDAVPGHNHEFERDDVLADGDKLPEDIARAIFPIAKGLDYAP